MKEIHVIKGDKEQSKLLRWLKLGVSKDTARETLTGIYVTPEAMVTTDGFRLHMAPTAACLVDHEGKILAGKIPAGDFLTELETVEANFPDYEQLIPDAAKKIVFEISVDSRYLSEAVKGLGGDTNNRVVLQFYGKNQPMVIIDPSKENPRKVVLMPMHMVNDQVYWDPRSTVIEEVEEEVEE